VPKSKVRQKKIYTPPTDIAPRVATRVKDKPSSIWLPVTAVALVILGIGWLVVFYLSTGTYPVASWGYWNLAIGFGLMVSALAVFSRWR
jgi:cell division protein CrgA